jgi:hypothetical protein
MIIFFMGGDAAATPQGSGEITGTGALTAEGEDMGVAAWLAEYNDETFE